ncbi:MAG: aspartate kinase [Crocinitomicaceae bacterium]|nr:aspartate kinase [Crocinitomicaceae bacterium]
MDRLSKVIERLINQSPFIQEAIAEGLINISSLARKLNPEIQKVTGKEVSDSAIIMAIKRMPPGPNQKIEMKIKNFMGQLGDLVVRSNLVKVTFNNYVGISQDQAKFLSNIKDISDNFYTVSRGISETTIITNAQFEDKLKSMFKSEAIISSMDNLSSITMKLPEVNTEISGVYYYLLKKIAWEGINLAEVISTTNEFTIVVDTTKVSHAFSVLMDLKTETLATADL